MPNMSDTGRLPSTAILRPGKTICLTNTMGAPEAVTDSTGRTVGINPDPHELSVATDRKCTIEGMEILREMVTATEKLYNVGTEFLRPLPRTLHAGDGARRDCENCDFRGGCVAVGPQLSRRCSNADAQDPVSDTVYTLRVQRRQLPMTIKTASRLVTLQGVKADPGLIFHWILLRLFSEELLWLAAYMSLSRPPSLAQWISLGVPAGLRNTIEGGRPQGILSKISDIFKKIQNATYLRAAEVMREFNFCGRSVSHYRALLQSMPLTSEDQIITTVRSLKQCYGASLSSLKATTHDCSSLLTGRVATSTLIVSSIAVLQRRTLTL